MIQYKHHGHEEMYAALHTVAELESKGISVRDRLDKIRKGELIRLRRGVFFPASLWQEMYPSERFLARIYAVHRMYPQAVFSHQSAATLQELPLLNIPHHVQIYCPFDSRGTIHGVQKFPRKNLQNRVITDEGIFCTPAAQTVVDCARTLDFPEALVIADSYANRPESDLNHLQELLTSTSGRGSAKARKVALNMSDKSDSAGETLLRLVMAQQGLPNAEQQYRVVCQGKVFFLDFAYPDIKVAIEFDGRFKYTDFGDTGQVLIREREREKMLTNEGWIFVRLTWDQVVNKPHQVGALIKRARDTAERRLCTS